VRPWQQVGDQRGRAGRHVHAANMHRAGPLREIFNTYARRDESGRARQTFHFNQS